MFLFILLCVHFTRASPFLRASIGQHQEKNMSCAKTFILNIILFFEQFDFFGIFLCSKC